jgi:cytochrome oxidase Cu insertion factor (SCO1/SenC/PrrC family)
VGLGALFALELACGGSSPVAAVGSGGSSLAVEARADETFGPVAGFVLTDQNGERFGLEDLLGKPFVAAAIFTTCAGPCPRITGHMKKLQDELAGTDVRLVSISVDPQYDTPEILSDYAERWGADTGRWSFLTGEKKAVFDLVQQGLWLAVQDDPEAARGFHVTHRTSIVAVDRKGERRGWYEGSDPGEVELLIERMRFLSGE